MEHTEVIERLEAELAMLAKQREALKAETAEILRQLPSHYRPAPTQAAAQPPRPTDHRELMAWLGRRVLAAQASVRHERAELVRFRVARCVETPLAVLAELKAKPAPAPKPKRFDAGALPAAAFRFLGGPVRIFEESTK